MNSNNQEISQIIINVRQKFLQEYENEKSLYYCSDVEKIKRNDWPIERYLLVNKDKEDATFKALVKAMKWRKSFGVLDRKDDDFPQEVYQCLGVIPYGKDKEGRPLLMITARYHRKSQELGTFQRQIVVHEIEKLDSQTSHQGWSVIVNLNQTSLSSIELDFAFWTIRMMQDYYPRGIKYVAILGMSWILTPPLKLVVSFSQELRDVVLFPTNEELRKLYVDEEELPAENGFGTNERPLLQIPVGCLSVEQMSDTFSVKQVEKIKVTFKDAIKDNPVRITSSD